MMMHADDFREDRCGVVSGLRDGGYSDDMTLAAIAGQHKRLISSPPVAVFPHPLASDLSFSRFGITSGNKLLSLSHMYQRSTG